MHGSRTHGFFASLLLLIALFTTALTVTSAPRGMSTHNVAFVANFQAAAANQITNINIDNVELIWNDTGLPPSSLNVTVTYYGRPAAPNNALIDDFAVHVFDPYLTEVFNGTVTSDNYGRFSITELEDAVHDVYIKPLNGLAVVETVFLNAGANPLSITLNRWGDATGDNRVDLYDFSTLAGAFGTSSGHPQFNAAADFNGDGLVSLLDFSLLAGSFGQIGEEILTLPPPPPTPITPTPTVTRTPTVSGG